jgi:uroporphyrin-III C-methyltransferase
VTVSLVGAGPGDPGLITVRGLERVRACEVLVYDRLVPRELVAEAPGSAIRIARDGRTQEAVNALLVAHGSQRRAVVRLKGGDPFVFGRGGEEALALAAAGVPFEIVPGVSSLGAVPAAAGIPVTHRGVSGSVTAVAAHDPGRLDFAALAAVGGTLVFFMGLARVRELAEGLAEHGLDPATPAAIVASGTTETQKTVTAPLARIAASAAGLESPALVVVGEAVSLADRLRPLRPAAPAAPRRPPRSRRAAAAPRPAPASSARHR